MLKGILGRIGAIAFRIGLSTFRPQPTVAFSDELSSDEALADTPAASSRSTPHRCSRWCHRTVFVRRPITWRPWDCGDHLVLREFGDPAVGDMQCLHVVQ